MMKSSTTSGQLDIYRYKVSLTFTVTHTQIRCTPSRGIWWPRAVLCHVILTFGYPLGQADIQLDVPPIEASGGQEWY